MISSNLFQLVCLFGILVPNCGGVSEPLMNGMFGSRGGDIVVTHATPVKGDAVLIAMDSKEEDLASSHSDKQTDMGKEMAETDVASLISHVVGSMPMGSSVPRQIAAFPSSTVLSKPQANVMVVVPGLGDVTVADMSMEHLQSLRETHPSFTLTSTFEPRHPLAQLTTLMTGQLPSTHGITGSTWMSPTTTTTTTTATSAFTDSGSHSSVPTVGDIVAHSFEGSLIASLSGCAQFASAASAHKGVKNAWVVSVDSKTKSMKRSSGSNSVSSTSLSDDVIADFIADQQSVLSQFRRDGGVINVDGSSVIVKPFKDASDGDTVVFDLSLPSDFKFFSELAATNQLLTDVTSPQGNLNHFVHDSRPDLFTLTLMGYDKLVKEYGVTDPKVTTAARILDASIVQTLETFRTAYHSDISSQVVLMGSPSVVADDARKTVGSVLSDSLHKEMDLDQTFPSIYVEEDISHDQLNTLCSRVNSAVTKHNMKAECIFEFTRPTLLQQKTSILKSSNSTITPSQIANYQINLWVSVILVLCLLGGLVPLITLDPTGGTFGSFLYAKKYI